MTKRQPTGGIDERKYAALCLALGMARGALYSALIGDREGAENVLECTSTEMLAQALGLSEGYLAVDWNDYLTKEETERIKGVPPSGASRPPNVVVDWRPRVEQVEAAARLLHQEGRFHHWWSQDIATYDELDPIGKDEFAAIVERILIAAYKADKT
jgi:hypothetical protein